MRHTRWTKIFREVTLRKTRTALVSTSIFIGVLGVVMLFSMGDITIHALEDAIDQDKLAMIRAYVTPSDVTAANDLAFFDTLSALPDITQVQGMAHYAFYWKHPGDEAFTKGAIFGYSVPLAEVALEPPELVTGRWPEAGQQEIAVERRFASAHGFAAGDPITLRILGDGTNGDTHEETWTVVGTVFQAYNYPELPGAPTYIPSDAIVFARLEDVRTISGVQGLNLIQARYPDYTTAEAQAETFKSTLIAASPYVSTLLQVEDPARNELIERTRTFDGILTMLALVSLLVSGFLVLNVINAMVIEQRRQIGVMKSLGATGGDNFLMYAGIAFVYGVIGVIPGLAAGIPLGFAAAENIAPEFNIFLDEFSVSTQAVVIGAVLGLVVPVFGAFLPVLVGIRVTILEAITDLGIDATYGVGPLARLLDVLPLPTSLKQALRNVSQKKGRLALTIITLALAAGAFMGVYATFDTFDRVIQNSLGQIGAQVSVWPRSAQDYDVIRELIDTHIDGISSIEPGISLAITIDGYEPEQIGPSPVYLIGVGINPANDEVVNFKLRSGRAWNDDPTREGVVISSGIANQMGVDTGDTITLRVGKRTIERKVLGVSRFPMVMLWARWDDLARLGGLTRGAPVPNEYVTVVTVDDALLPAVGIDQRAANVLPLTSGEFVTPGTPGVMVTTAFAADNGYALGDLLTIAAGEDTLTLPVTGTFDIPASLSPTGQAVDHAVALYWEDLARLEGQPLDGEPVPMGFDIVLKQADPTMDDVEAMIDQINNVLVANGINANYTNWIKTRAETEDQLGVAQTVLNTAATLIAAVGAIGLLSTLSMAVFERQKEIGVMRSVGATSYAVAFQFLVEGLVVGVIAWLLGIPFSWLLDQALLVGFHFETVAEAAYPALALVYGAVGTLLIATVASLWPSIAAARKTVSDILRYQ